MLEDDLTTTLARLGLATALGLALGFERERRGHDAGLRTHGLVSLSSSMLTLSALELVEHHGEGDPVRVIQGLAQAIGFIAGGLIFVRGGDVRNMTTAGHGNFGDKRCQRGPAPQVSKQWPEFLEW